jgi:hypothetical protein
MTYRIPEKIQLALAAYVRGEHPFPFGSFVTAVLANDFVGALGLADDYASYLHNEMPGRSGDPEKDVWGSYAAVNNTIARQRKEQEITAWAARAPL